MPDDEKLPFFLLCICYGFYFFVLNLLPYAGSLILREQAWMIFVTSWISVPPLSAASSIAIQHLKRVVFRDDRAFYPLLLFVDAGFLTIAVWGLRLSRLSIHSIALLFPLVNLFALLTVLAARHLKAEGQGWRSFLGSMYFWTPVLIGLAVFNFSAITLSTRYVLIAIMIGLLACMSVFHDGLVKHRFGENSTRVLDGVVALVMGLIVFDPNFHFDAAHYSYYLGPTSDLMAGKSMLVDINCQYGVFVIYFLALLFQMGIAPLSHHGLSFLISVLLILQYGFIYALLRNVLKSVIFSVTALCLIITVNFFSQVDYAATYPSTGPLRFGLVYLLLGIVTLRTTYPKARMWLEPMEWGLVGIASVWSVETFIYVVSTYIAVVLYESFSDAADIREFVARLRRSLFAMAICVSLAYLLVAIDVRLRSGQWPHWQYYWDYLGLYSLESFGTYPLAPWSPWLLIVGIYFVSLMGVIYKLVLSEGKEGAAGLKVVFGMTISGIAQFTYFLGRSHPNNLYHISIPAIFVASYWIAKIPSLLLQREFQRSFTYICYYAMILLFVLESPKVVLKAKTTGLYSLIRAVKQSIKGEPLELKNQLAALWSRSPTNVRVGEATYLIEKYSAGEPRVALFIAHHLASEALMLSKKANVFPIGNLESQAARTRALNFQHNLKPGDMVFLESEPSKFDQGEREIVLEPVQFTIVRKLCREFDFKVEEITNSIVAARLLPLGHEQPWEWMVCHRVQTGYIGNRSDREHG